jgi:hypothetical protein
MLIWTKIKGFGSWNYRSMSVEETEFKFGIGYAAIMSCTVYHSLVYLSGEKLKLEKNGKTIVVGLLERECDDFRFERFRDLDLLVGNTALIFPTHTLPPQALTGFFQLINYIIRTPIGYWYGLDQMQLQCSTTTGRDIVI